MVWYNDQPYTIKAELLIWFLQKLYQLHPFITGSLEIELLSLKRKNQHQFTRPGSSQKHISVIIPSW